MSKGIADVDKHMNGLEEIKTNLCSTDQSDSTTAYNPIPHFCKDFTPVLEELANRIKATKEAINQKYPS